MKPTYIPDTVIYGVTDKIPNIKFKNNMKKVYVLICDSVTRGEQETDVKTFSAKAKAQAEMKKCFEAELNDWKSWCEEKDLMTEEEDMSKCIFELGWYSENHIDWTIYEQEVL